MPTADRNLLFGILAFQNNFVSRDELTAALQAWLGDKSRDLGQLLQERDALNKKQYQLLTELIDEFIKQLGSAEKCLQQLSSLANVREELANLGDPDVEQSLRHLAPHWDSLDVPDVTGPSALGSRSAVGERFRILRPHAEGGLGKVSVAHDKELNREVALKEIKGACADDPDSRARFTLEAEITGGLEHPGIVPVYGLGQSADGRPFYVMRFIRGDSLNAAIKDFHREAHQLTETERNLRLRRLLQRFIDVCEAIHYAHSRGVLHRDLKPGNIMLGKYGETLVVDWGLARAGATDPHAATKSARDEPSFLPQAGASPTIAGQAVGTPAYMSPEQAAGRLDLLGPETDIYSLGATLYAILTGSPPVEGGSTAEVLKNVTEGQITQPRKRNRRIPQSLEAVALRALALRPANRYPTALALAEEIEHWLGDEPVEAYCEPVVAQVRRVLRKRPGVAGSAFATLVVGLLAFGASYLVVQQKNRALSRTNAELTIARQAALEQSHEAKRQEGIAIAQRQAADDNAARATKNAELATKNAELAASEKERLRKAMDFLVAAFRKPDPSQDGRNVKAASLLLSAAEEAQTTLGDEPLLQAELLTAIFETLDGLGLVVEAVLIAEEAVQIRQKQLGPEHPETLTSLGNLAHAYQSAGQLKKALPLYEQTLQVEQATLGANHPATLTSMNNLASAYEAAGQLEKALPLFEETLRKVQATFGANHPDTLTLMGNLAELYRSAGQLDKALPLYEQSLQKRQALLGIDHPDTLRSLSNLASAYGAAGQLDEALRLHAETLQKRRAKLGEDHPATLMSLNNLAHASQAVGQLDKALPLFTENLQKLQAKLGPDHPDTLTAMHNLASAYAADRDFKKALPLFEETLRKRRAKLGPDHPDSLRSMNNLAYAYKSAGQFDKALPLYEETLATRREKLGAEHPSTLISLNNLKVAYLDNQQPEKALPLWQEFVGSIRKAVPPESLQLAQLLASGALDLLEGKAWLPAEEALREALAIRAKQQPEDWTTFNTRSLLGGALASRGAELMTTDEPAGEKLFTEAEPLLIAGMQEMLARKERIPAEARIRLTEAAQRLVDLYTAWERPAEVEKWQGELAKLKAELAEKK